MKLPSIQTLGEPRFNDTALRSHAEHALDAWMDSLSPAERGTLVQDRRRRDDPNYRRRLGIARDRRRA